MKKLLSIIAFLILSNTLSGQGVEEYEISEITEEPTTLPLAVVEEVPVFPGCEEIERKNMRNCFNEQIQSHIAKHFRYPEEAQKKKLEGRVRIFFTFAIDGNITNIEISGPHAILEEEAKRIINLLPKILPGKQRGKPINVDYVTLLNFRLQ